MGLQELYKDKLMGAIKGLDRIRFRGTIRWMASERGIRSLTHKIGLLFKDYGSWAEKKTATLRRSCTQQAQVLGLPVRYLRSSQEDKEELARTILSEQGTHGAAGSICLLSVVEPCQAPAVEGNRATQKLELNYRSRKCIHLYHYFDHPELGFGHVRLQSWVPFGVTVCLNGRHRLEKQLLREGLGYIKTGNCFNWLEDCAAAQQLLDEQLATAWPAQLDALVRLACPALDQLLEPPLRLEYYWSAEESEWATDLMFASAEELDRLYGPMVRQSLLTSDAPSVMRYLGKGRHSSSGKLEGRIPEQIMSDLVRRHEGVRIKHSVGKNSVKAYNKAGNVLRIETTINDTRQFKVYRRPEDDPERELKWLAMRKGVADLHRRCQVSDLVNERYGAALGASLVEQTLQEVASSACRRRTVAGRRYRALNPWSETDQQVLEFLARGQWALSGFRNKDLREHLFGVATDPSDKRRQSAKVSRLLGLLRAHGLINKVAKENRYVLSDKGRKFSTALLSASHVEVHKLMELAA